MHIGRTCIAARVQFGARTVTVTVVTVAWGRVTVATAVAAAVVRSVGLAEWKVADGPHAGHTQCGQQPKHPARGRSRELELAEIHGLTVSRTGFRGLRGRCIGSARGRTLPDDTPHNWFRSPARHIRRRIGSRCIGRPRCST